jgi:hypothetical protein
MRHKEFGIIAVAAASVLLAMPADAQSRPRLHVSSRWDQCSIQLDPSLTQSAWRQFTKEAGQVVYFRPLAEARPMGRGKFEFSFMQYQTNIDDHTSAWNDTFVHPDSTHWLYEGSGLQFPGLAFRAGVSSSTDVGVYFTKNIQANYGAYGLQLQQNLIRGGPRDWSVSARGSYVSLFGPEDVDVNVYGLDVVTSWKQWAYRAVTVVPYAGVATYLATSHEKTAAVNLADEHPISAIGTVGAALQFSVVRLAAEASMSQVPSIAMKVGIGR